jgi:hypothetical protein
VRSVTGWWFNSLPPATRSPHGEALWANPDPLVGALGGSRRRYAHRRRTRKPGSGRPWWPLGARSQVLETVREYASSPTTSQPQAAETMPTCLVEVSVPRASPL